MEKITKPNTCEECPVGHINKRIIQCGVYEKLQASINNNKERYAMWKNCPLDWDK